ncbi:hypothetical protein [Paragemmobacter ruber]|uniref:C2H2-type domain-containing protein n=1 Tax=Paragemmobacter ruber TaxID=1985673 RepID=A0ABW9Y0D1_9RHOB|nr:hypothetical protein [Rhodobacter ruber]NBE05950.1 hypothetical protein [Rhodobacter ruber]
MTGASQTRPAHGVARHLGAAPAGGVEAWEPFKVYAAREIEAAPFWDRGVCFNAGCGRRFEPRRDWQMFCCEACERAFVAEARLWGHRMAPALLVHRMGKWEREDAARRDLVRAARRFVTQAQSGWVQVRAARDRAAGVVR